MDVFPFEVEDPDKLETANPRGSRESAIYRSYATESPRLLAQLKRTATMTFPNDALMTWLRVQMLRLRSFDWGQGSWTIHWLKDGVTKFRSNYSIERLSSQLGVSEDDILTFIDSPPALEEMASKSVTASWTGRGLTLS